MDETFPRKTATAPALDPLRICTLPPDSLGERIAWIREEILPHARRTEFLEAGLAWELEGVPGLAEKVDRLIALERECCSGVVFERTSAAPDRIRLEVRGIDPESGLFRLLSAPASRAPSRSLRAAAAAGIGTFASLAVCCGLPLLAGALLGSLAVPLRALDAPVPLALGAGVGAGAAWWWLGRRRVTVQRGSCGCARSVSS
jgi:hypothetical protein